jgi:hypothetical protein
MREWLTIVSEPAIAVIDAIALLVILIGTIEGPQEALHGVVAVNEAICSTRSETSAGMDTSAAPLSSAKSNVILSLISIGRTSVPFSDLSGMDSAAKVAWRANEASAHPKCTARTSRLANAVLTGKSIRSCTEASVPRS